MRKLLAAFVLVTLAACGRQTPSALVDSRTPPALGPRYYAPDGWAWGVISLPKAPRIRYGTAAPDGTVRAHVILLPAYGESAEVYFETARDLLAHGYEVWTLEPAGQGGSARFPGPVDLGRSNGFGLDAEALQGLIAYVVRAEPSAPVVVAASGSSAVTALMAAGHGLKPLDGLFLWEPALSPVAGADHAREMTRWRLGWLRADGGRGWRRPERDLSGRATLAEAWQLANPDLRMGGPAWEWLAALDDARSEAMRSRSASDPRLKLLILESKQSSDAEALCVGSSACTVQVAPCGPLPRQLASGPVRNAWIGALVAFTEARVAEHVHGV